MAKVTIIKSELTSVLEDVLLKELESEVKGVSQKEQSSEPTSVPKRELKKVVELSLDEFFILTRALKNRLWEIEERLGDSSTHPMNKERLEEELEGLKSLLKDLES